MKIGQLLNARREWRVAGFDRPIRTVAEAIRTAKVLYGTKGGKWQSAISRDWVFGTQS